MKDKFIQLCKDNIHRDGLNDLLNWLEKSDFYLSPASTKYHGNFEGGLVEHSIKVYERLVQLIQATGVEAKEETIVIVSLLHDVCKANSYKLSMRNVKENDVWVQKPFYEFEEYFPFGGHGSKSVFIVQQFMKLSPEEGSAICNHMGQYDRSPTDYSLSAAYKKYPLGLLLHSADNIASLLDEKTV